MGFEHISRKRQVLLRSIGDYSTHEKTDPVVTDHGDHYVITDGASFQVVSKDVTVEELVATDYENELYGKPILSGSGSAASSRKSPRPSSKAASKQSKKLK